MPVPLLAACSLVAPALLAARAEKAVLRMIAAESAIFAMLNIVISPSFVLPPTSWRHTDKIDKRSRYSRRNESQQVTSDNFFITSQWSVNKE
jgi:hypothetical protein